MVILNSITSQENRDKNLGSNYYSEYLYSSEFKNIVIWILSLDEIFNQNNIKNAFTNFFNWKHLLENEKKLINRVLNDKSILNLIYDWITQEHFKKLKDHYFKNKFHNLPFILWAPLEDKNAEKIRLRNAIFNNLIYFWKEELNYSVLQGKIQDKKDNIMDIIWIFDGKDIKEIAVGKKYTLIWIGKNEKPKWILDYSDFKCLLYNKETWKIERDMDIFNILERTGLPLLLQNWDIIVEVTAWTMNHYLLSLNSWKKITPYYNYLSNKSIIDWKTIVWISINNNLSTKPYSLEDQEFLDSEKYKEPQSPKDPLIDLILKSINNPKEI